MSDASTDVSNPDTPPFPSFRSEYDKDDERYKDNTLDFSGISISDKEKKKDNQDESEPRLILQEHKSKTSHENKVCVLKCTHPEGSPFLSEFLKHLIFFVLFFNLSFLLSPSLYPSLPLSSLFFLSFFSSSRSRIHHLS